MQLQRHAIWALQCPATFERLMESVPRGVQWQHCLVYLDDIIVVRLDSMIEKLTQVFDRLLTARLKLKARKCNYLLQK